MAETDTKLNPAEETTASEQPKLVKDETEKVTSAVTDDKGKEDQNKSTEDKAGSSIAGVAATAASVKDNVFSMFGGGPAKQKKEVEDDPEEPSGSSKAKKAEGEV
jgi:Ran-binding protein 1